ncbi:MAG: PIN domain-containing protein [Chloroflexi bacterium]|nr:PIN domain-containing protein [Chloroflexota bacterium]
MPTDRAIAQRGGEIRRKHQLKLPDAIIAASCMRSGGHLFSKDPHFRRLIKVHVVEGTIY